MKLLKKLILIRTIPWVLAGLLLVFSIAISRASYPADVVHDLEDQYNDHLDEYGKEIQMLEDTIGELEAELSEAQTELAKLDKSRDTIVATEQGSQEQPEKTARVDLKKEERLEASKKRLEETYEGSLSLQSSLQKAAAEDMAKIETLISSLSDVEWEGVKASHERLEKTYFDSPSLHLSLLENEIKAFREIQ